MAGKRKKGEKSEPAAFAADGDPADGPRNVDEALDGLERIVGELEAGDLPLEQALSRFEKGVRFARRGGELLDAVEERVEMLLSDREETVPFEHEEVAPFEREDAGESDDGGV